MTGSPAMRAEASRASRLYLTDGGHLYRFLDWVGRSRKSMLAAVEDCRSLEIVLVSAERLRTWSEVSTRAR